MEDNFHIPNAWLDSTISKNISRISLDSPGQESSSDDADYPVENSKLVTIQLGNSQLTINPNPPPPEVLLRKSLKMTKKYKKEAKKGEAIRESVKCVAFSRLVHGNGSVEHLSANLNLARNYISLQSNTVRAGEIISSVLDDSNAEKEDSKFCGLLLSVSLVLVKSQLHQKNYKSAEADLLRVIRLWRRIRRVFSADEGMCWSLEIQKTASLVYCAVNKLDKAEECLVGAMEDCRRLVGLNHPNMIELLQIEAKIQRQSRPDDRQEPIKTLKKAYSIANSNDGREKMAEITFELAKLLSNCGGEDNLDESESYFHECLLHHQKMGKSTALIALKQSYSCFLMKRNNYIRAVDILGDLVPLCLELCGENSHELGETFKLLSSALTLAKNYSAALKNLRKYLKVLRANGAVGDIKGAEQGVERLESMVDAKK